MEATGFYGRTPLESIYAMGAALEKAALYQDCVSYYYQYRTRQGAPWDAQGYLAERLNKISDEAAARKLMADIDQKIKEYRYEG